MIKVKTKIIKYKLIFIFTRSLKIKKNKTSKIKIMNIRKKIPSAARLTKIFGSLFKIISLFPIFLLSFIPSCCLPFKFALTRSFEIIKIIRNKNNAINIIIPNEDKFEM
jgi:hypothetical protein